MDPAIDLVVRATLALVFASAAVHKARELSTFRSVLADYRLLPTRAVSSAAVLLIIVEAALAVALLSVAWREQALGAAIVILAIYSGAIALNLARGRSHIDCGCGGSMNRQSLQPWLVFRNGMVAAIAMAAAASPLAPRQLVMVDAVTVLGGVTCLAAVYAAANHLVATWPDHSRLARLS